VIGIEIWAMVQDFKSFGNILQTLNATFLALIPKENGANTLDKIFPIA
jgi:hypothetical protein